MNWHHSRGVLDCSRGHLIGILNATPDSLTDRGAHWGTERSVAHGLRLAAQGASVVEVGGESLRGGTPLHPDEEIARVVPVIEELVRRLDMPVAVDTFKWQVAEAAFHAGASILNDPTGLREPDMARVAAQAGAGVVMAHFFGPPKVHPLSYPDVDVPNTVVAWAKETMAFAAAAGIPAERIAIDPGIGLGKSPAQDLDLLHRLDEVVALGRPVYVPISHKKVIGAVTNQPNPKRRLAGTAATLAWCRARGASLFRIHNVRFLRPVLEMSEALVSGHADLREMVD